MFNTLARTEANPMKLFFFFKSALLLTLIPPHRLRVLLPHEAASMSQELLRAVATCHFEWLRTVYHLLFSLFEEKKKGVEVHTAGKITGKQKLSGLDIITDTGRQHESQFYSPVTKTNGLWILAALHTFVNYSVKMFCYNYEI